MLVVEPSAARFEVPDSMLSTNEHLLERVSATENRITRLADRLERSLELVIKQAQNSYFDRTLVTALVDVLAADGLIDKARLEQLWNKRCQVDANDEKEKGEPRERARKRSPKGAREKASSQKKLSTKRSRS